MVAARTSESLVQPLTGLNGAQDDIRSYHRVADSSIGEVSHRSWKRVKSVEAEF
jgi:hypothetical protein